MKYRQYLHHLNSPGFSLIEVLVTMTLMSTISAMVAGAVISQKQLFKSEVSRTSSSQDLRGLFGLIGSEVRLSGEQLPEAFPAITLEDGASGASDVLTIRRNLLDVTLKLCKDLGPPSNTNNRTVAFSSNTFDSFHNLAPAGCDVFSTFFDPSSGGSGRTNYATWREFWQNEYNSGSGRGYIYKKNGRIGEFFEFERVEIYNDAGFQALRLRTTANPTWSNPYSFEGTNEASIFLLEEWKLSLTNNNLLQLIDSGDAANPLNLSANMTDFQVTINMQDGTAKNSFTTADNWTKIKNIHILITAVDPTDSSKTTSWESQYFPRNIISTAR